VLAPIAIGKGIAASGPWAKAQIKTYGKPLTYRRPHIPSRDCQQIS